MYNYEEVPDGSLHSVLAVLPVRQSLGDDKIANSKQQRGKRVEEGIVSGYSKVVSINKPVYKVAQASEKKHLTAAERECPWVELE